MEKCSYGTMNDEECHKLTHVTISGKSFIQDFDPVEGEVLMWRSGLSLINADADVCLHHMYCSNIMNLCRNGVAIPFKVIRNLERVGAIFSVSLLLYHF